MTFLFSAQAVVSVHVFAADINTAQDAEALLFSAQDQFISLSPPSEQVYVHRNGFLYSLDWAAMPDGIRKGLPPGMVGGLPVYELRVFTDPATRETVFHNKWDTEVYRMVASNAGGDAFAWMKAKYGVSSRLHLDEWTRWIYDPAHIGVTLHMVPETLRDSFVETLEENTALAMEFYAPMAMMAGSSLGKNFTISVTGVTNGLVELTVEWPTNFTDTLEIFATPNLVEPAWELALTDIVTVGGTNHVWEDPDTTDFNGRFYVVGNMGVDSDSDDLPDAREIYLHGTATHLYDTDSDGLGDGEEVNSNGQFGDTDGYITNPFRPDRVDYTLPAPAAHGPVVSWSAFDAFDPPTTNLTVSTNAPAISEWLRMADAGETVTLSAEALSDTSRFLAFGQSAAGKVLSDGQILRREGRLAAVRMPNALPTNTVYLLWPRNDYGYGEPVAVNQAEAWWVGPDEVATNEAFSVFGRNLSLGGTPCHLYVEEATQWIESVSTTPYKADFIWPTNLTGSTYTLWAHNGHGREHGWSDPVEIEIDDPIIWDGPVTNVVDFGADGSDDMDDTDAIKDAIDALTSLGEAGYYGTVYFPSGTYIIRERINNIGVRKRLVGDGPTNTIITTENTYLGGSGFGMIDKAMWKVEISSIGFVPESKYLGKVVSCGQSTYVTITNCAFSQLRCVSKEDPVDFKDSSHIRFVDNTFEINHNVFCGNAEQVLFENCIFRGLRDANALLKINGARDVSLTGCIASPLDDSDASNGLGWLKGRFVASNTGTIRSIHISNTSTTNMCPRYAEPFLRASPIEVDSMAHFSGDIWTQKLTFASLDRENAVGADGLLSTNPSVDRIKFGLNVYSWDQPTGEVVVEGYAGGLLNPPTTNITAIFWDDVDDNSGEQILFEGLDTHFTGSVSVASSNTVTCPTLDVDYSGRFVVVVDGRGLGQHRLIDSVNTVSGAVTTVTNWRVVPDETSQISIGYYVDHVAIHNNSFDGHERAADPHFMTPGASGDYTNYTATCGVSFYGAVLGSVMDGNTVTDVRTGLRNWSQANSNDADTAVVVQPNYFNLIANNTISNAVGGLADAFGEDEDGMPAEGLAIAGTVWRNNNCGGLTGYAAESYADYDAASIELNIFENNVFHGGLVGVRTLENALSPIFIGNQFSASGIGVEFDAGTEPALRVNGWDGFTTDYAGTVPGGILHLPINVAELNGTQTNVLLDVWNVGTSNLVWSASTMDGWITLLNTNGVLVDERSAGILGFSIDPSAIPSGISNGAITVLGGGQTNNVSVHFE